MNYTNNNDRNTTFEQTTTGFQGRVGVPLTEYVSLIGRYTFNIDDVTLDKSQFFSDRLVPGQLTCDPLIAGRYLCDALGNRTSSILGASLVYDTLDNRARPTRGRTAVVSADLAGLGGSVKYARLRFNAAQYIPLPAGFIFSLSGEGGVIKSLQNRGNATNGIDDIRLTDRFYLGEPQMRGFDIRGVGPRVIRSPLIAGPDGKELKVTDRNQITDDALGGKYYYLAHAEIEIPLGSGVRELGIRPSVFVDAGALFGITKPVLQKSPFPNGIFVPTRDANGVAQFEQINMASVVGGVCTPSAITLVPNSVNPNPPACLTSNLNSASGSTIPPFIEEFFGNSAKPRLSVGIGVNWNSPFGPFRIDFARALLKEKGDDTKAFTFNVGTQF